MYDTFQVEAGTIPGRRHVGTGNLLVGKNNQDAYGFAGNDRFLVAGVFDGCSSAQHSEVGAQIAARIVPDVVLAAATKAHCHDALSTPAFWDEVKQTLLARFASLAICINEQTDNVVVDHFLFTILGVILTDSNAVLFSMGDGVYAINNIVHRIGPFADNAPPYLCYELLRPEMSGRGLRSPLPLQFAITVIPTADCSSLLIGTDGAIDLLTHHSVATVLGKESLALWFRKLNSEVVTIGEMDGVAALKRSYGILPDDTTIVALTRKRGA